MVASTEPKKHAEPPGKRALLDAAERLADDLIEIPAVDEFLQPIVSIIPLQLLAYHVAVLKGTDVDQPRNLAKSVTVE